MAPSREPGTGPRGRRLGLLLRPHLPEPSPVASESIKLARCACAAETGPEAGLCYALKASTESDGIQIPAPGESPRLVLLSLALPAPQGSQSLKAPSSVARLELRGPGRSCGSQQALRGSHEALSAGTSAGGCTGPQGMEPKAALQRDPKEGMELHPGAGHCVPCRPLKCRPLHWPCWWEAPRSWQGSGGFLPRTWHLAWQAGRAAAPTSLLQRHHLSALPGTPTSGGCFCPFPSGGLTPTQQGGTIVPNQLVKPSDSPRLPAREALRGMGQALWLPNHPSGQDTGQPLTGHCPQLQEPAPGARNLL